MDFNALVKGLDFSLSLQTLTHFHKSLRHKPEHFTARRQSGDTRRQCLG